MYCENCGSELTGSPRFCPSCGQPVAQAASERTTVRRRRAAADPSAEVTKTVRIARPAEAAQTARQPRHTPTPEPEPRRRSVLPVVLVALLLAAAIAGALLLSGGCTGPRLDEAQPPEATEGETAAQEAQPTDEGAPAETDADDEAEAEVNPEGIRAGGPEQDGPDQATLDAWSDTARALMAVYPVNHVSDGTTEPSHLDIGDWAQRCLSSIDPASELGQALQYDPEGVAADLGFYEAAQVVTDVTVTGASAEGVSVVASIEGTQSDWGHTISFDEEFFLQFNDAGLVTSITYVG